MGYWCVDLILFLYFLKVSILISLWIVVGFSPSIFANSFSSNPFNAKMTHNGGWSVFHGSYRDFICHFASIRSRWNLYEIAIQLSWLMKNNEIISLTLLEVYFDVLIDRKRQFCRVDNRDARYITNYLMKVCIRLGNS